MLDARLAAVDDVAFMWSMLFRAAHADEQPGATVESIRADPDLGRYLDDWGRRGDLGLIATDHERPVAAAWLRLFAAHETQLVTYVTAEVPELAIAVEPDRTGQGVGSFLLRRLMGEADAAGIPAVVLSARANNPAIQLYQRFGFVETDRIVNRIGTWSVKLVRERPGNDPAAALQHRAL